jgi:hypothetical protein
MAAKSCVAAASYPGTTKAEGWKMVTVRGKRPQQTSSAAKPAATKPTDPKAKATLFTKYTIHFRYGKPALPSITAACCLKVWGAVHETLSAIPEAWASGAAQIKCITVSCNGSLLAEWLAQVKASAILHVVRAIEKVVATEFGHACQLKSDKAWTRIVVEHVPAHEADGTFFFVFFESAFDIPFARKVQIWGTPRPGAVYRTSYAMEQDAGPKSKLKAGLMSRQGRLWGPSSPLKMVGSAYSHEARETENERRGWRGVAHPVRTILY